MALSLPSGVMRLRDWLIIPVNLLQVIAFVIALSSQMQGTDENGETKTKALVDVNEVTESTGRPRLTSMSFILDG